MNPYSRRYGIILLFLVIVIVSIVEPLMLYVDLFSDIVYILLQITGRLYNLSSGLLLFFAFSALEKDAQEFKNTKLLKILSLTWFVLAILEVFLNYSLGLLVFFSFLLIFYAFFYLFALPILLSVSIMLIGIKNRDRYGNYLISGSIMYLISSIMITIMTPINQSFILVLSFWGASVQESLTALAIIISYFLIAVFTISLYSIYFLFFSIRTKNRYLTVWSIIGLILPIFSFISYLWLGLLFSMFGIFLILGMIIPLVVGILVSMKFFELGKRFRRGLRVFISHSVGDFKKYRVKEIAKYLESQKGIGRVFYCEIDLVGNIDEWMHKIVPRSNLLVFISSEDSLVSQDCKTELALAEANNLKVIPVLGWGLVWDDLKDLTLNRELGANFDPMGFDEFCTQLYELIIKNKEVFDTKISQVKEKRKLRRKKKVKEV